MLLIIVWRWSGAFALNEMFELSNEAEGKGGTERCQLEETVNVFAAPLCELAECLLGLSPNRLGRNDVGRVMYSSDL